jgi:uncharacterized membrane protein YfcA
MEYLFLVSVFIIAFLYASVGHGGASGYLAIMALFGIAPIFMKPTALTLNIFVSAIAFFAFFKAGYFRLRLIFPFLIGSIPLAFIGAGFNIDPKVYKLILSIFLLIAIGRMLFVPKSITENSKEPPFLISLLVGAALGFFFGLIGIGGGIILSPLLILMHWANLKESAAASAIFILLNSVSGLFALFQTGLYFEPRIVICISIGILGGLAGSYSGSIKIKSEKLKYLLAGVLLLASIKLIIF